MNRKSLTETNYVSFICLIIAGLIICCTGCSSDADTDEKNISSDGIGEEYWGVWEFRTAEKCGDELVLNIDGLFFRVQKYQRRAYYCDDGECTYCPELDEWPEPYEDSSESFTLSNHGDVLTVEGYSDGCDYLYVYDRVNESEISGATEYCEE